MSFLSKKQEFYKLFYATAQHQNPQEVFADFVKTSAIAIHNSGAFCKDREERYFSIIEKYSDEDKQNFCHMLSQLILMLQEKPYDVLGEAMSELGLTNDKAGQFFTPFAVSAMCVKIGFDEEQVERKAFVTVSDPASGTGGMLLAFVGELIQRGYDPAEKVFCEAVDVDEVVALCAYLQLSLWNVPSRIVIGNSLSMEYRESWYTPASIGSTGSVSFECVE
jgi:type I restriction-modification system DNA methylase subunit